jgi:hypothetical protein
MDQSVELNSVDRRREIRELSRFVAASVDAAQVGDAPFYHLVFERVFPDDVYSAMLAAMPVAADYRPMSGRATRNDLADGTHTRVKIDLFPEYIRSLPAEKRSVWDVVGAALCSTTVKEAFIRRLEPALSARFGANFERVGMYPMPILTRDIAGYHIPPHPDTHWKGITVQLYLPRDLSIAHVGTIFHERLPDGRKPKRKQMSFAPNTGYAFAVDKHTWHSVDMLGPEVTSRDSILLTYFVDSSALQYLRNRVKRAGNFIRHEFQRVTG